MGWERESQSHSRERAICKSIWTAQVELDGLKGKEDKKFGRQGGGGSPRKLGKGLNMIKNTLYQTLKE